MMAETKSGDYSPVLTKKPLLIKKKKSFDHPDEKVKSKLNEETLKAQCVPAAIKVRKLTPLRQDSDLTVYLSSDDEGSCSSKSTWPVDKTARGVENQPSRSSSSSSSVQLLSSSSSSSRSSVSRLSEASSSGGKTSPVVVKSVQKKITDYKISVGVSPKLQSSSSSSSSDIVVLKENNNGGEPLEKSKSTPAQQQTAVSTEKPLTKRSKEYTFVSYNNEIEDQIKKCSSLKQLTEDQIYYLVLRDVNRLIDIFSGCLKSWRHDEFNKSRTNRILYENSALSNFTQVQFTSAYRGLETIFCKKSHKYDDYLLNVLLPEVLIGICARVYECSPENAEEFLRVTHAKSDLDSTFPKGSLKAANKMAAAAAPARVPKLTKPPPTIML